MSNSFGFGGNNAALIFSQPDTIPHTRPLKPAAVTVTGIGMIGPGRVLMHKVEPPMPPDELKVHSCGQLDTSSLTPNQRRRLSRFIQLALLATRSCPPPTAGHRVAVALGSGLGAIDEGSILLENWIVKDERESMPARFPGSVHNAPAAQIAIEFGARGLNSAPTAADISFEAALWQGMCQLASGEADCALVGGVDELNKYPLGIGKRWGFWTDKTLPGEGAMVAQIVPDETDSDRSRRRDEAESQPVGHQSASSRRRLPRTRDGTATWPLSPAVRRDARSGLDHGGGGSDAGERHFQRRERLAGAGSAL